MKKTFLSVSVLSCIFLGSVVDVEASTGQPEFNIIGQTLSNRVNPFAGQAGTVNIINSSFDNSAYSSNFAEFCGPMFITNSSVSNIGVFGKSAYSIDINNSSVTNLYPGQFHIGMSSYQTNPLVYVGTLTISGTSNVYNTGRFGQGDGYYILEGGTCFNDEGQMCLGMTKVTQTDGIFINNGEFARGVPQIDISGGSVFNEGAFATLGGTVNFIDSSYIENLEDGTIGHNIESYLTLGTASYILNSGQIGPTGLKLSGATLENNGIVYVGRLSFANYSAPGNFLFPYLAGYAWYKTPPTSVNDSFLTSGSIVGSGEMYFSGNVTVDVPISQKVVTIGKCMAASANYYCNFVHSNTLEANVIITGSGSFYSTGTVVGNVEALSSSNLTPGGLVDTTDELNLVGDLILRPNSTLTIDFDNDGNDKINITGGNLYLAYSDPKPILNLYATGIYAPGSYYELIDLGSAQQNSIQDDQKIFGEFTIVKAQPLVNLTVGYSPSLVYLYAGFNPFSSLYSTSSNSQSALALSARDSYSSAVDYYDPFGNGHSCLKNKVSLCHALDELNGHANACLQNKIDEMLLLTGPELDGLFSTLDPSQFKGEQIVLEELVFAANEELLNQLHLRKKGISTFALGGFRRFNQLSYNHHIGFKANSGFEGLGVIYGDGRSQFSITAGALETTTKYKHLDANSTTGSVFGQIGASKSFNRWQLGADVLFAYNFITTHRKIDYFDMTASSNHGGSITKGALFASYLKKEGNFNIRPYDKFYYIFNHENSFKETGASCLSTYVKSSDRQVIRNDLGFTLEMFSNQVVRPYVDLAYVYEYRWDGKSYKASFIDTSTQFVVSGIEPSRNFAKYAFGLIGTKKNWDYRLNFEGMYSSKLREAGVSVSLSKKF